MDIFLRLTAPSPYLAFPRDPAGWLGLLILAGLVALLALHWKRYNKPVSQTNLLLFGGLLIAGAATALLVGIRLPAGQALPRPGIPEDPGGAVAMVFSAIPWMLAGGLLGPFSAAVIGLLSGLLTAFFSNQGASVPLLTALLAVLFSAAVNQRYGTPAFSALRRPVISAALLALFFPFLHFLDAVLITSGVLAIRIDYAVTHLRSAWMAVAIQLLVGGVFTGVCALALSGRWGQREPLGPSPAEKSLQTRFLYSVAPLALLLIISLMAGNWLVAGNAARRMLQARMQNTARLAADNIPHFLQSGQNQIQSMASDPALLETRDPDELNKLLGAKMRAEPFFSQLYLIDLSGFPVAGYPLDTFEGSQPPAEEQRGIQLALSGVQGQAYTLPPAAEGQAARVSFIATVFNPAGEIRSVLVGRTELDTNPLTRPVLASLDRIAEDEGQGMLIDSEGLILYHPNPKQVMNTAALRAEGEPQYYDGTAPDGTRSLVYVQPAPGTSWSVAVTVPAHRWQQLAIDLALPLMVMILALSLLSILVLRFGLRHVTANLESLAVEAGRISAGQLDHPLAVNGDDEVGQLRRAFEQMRSSLKDRLEELNRLLAVSQGVASTLEIGDALQPVLEAALSTGATTARVVLAPSVVPDFNDQEAGPVSFGAGPTKDLYSDLDDQVLALSRKQERVLLANLSRPRLLHLSPTGPRPASLLALALRHENLFYGTLWVAYDRPHNFTEEETRFLVTLAGQAALAAANAHLFLSAEVGRQRLAAILASTPDPVLVTDQHDRLLLTNPAAWQALDLGIIDDEDRPLEEVISQPELVRLLRSSSDEQQSVEITLPDGRVCLATASSVIAEGQRVGRVCLLRDVTYFKQLDALKSEFVSTVSHDLRSPLTLMRGYATMLEMVGELNEQQAGYVRKIVTGVESMSRLVNNLLDLGRIEAGVGLQVEMVPVHDVIEKVIGALQLQASQKKIKIEVDIPRQNVPLIEADQALLHQALQNLVENAIKYTNAEGRVRVRLQPRQDRMVFEVSDTGIGISPMDQPRLFERFFRGAQNAPKDERGTGLGLAIVKSIAERHGGQVWVESQLGKGSTFYFSIPLRQPRQETVRT